MRLGLVVLFAACGRANFDRIGPAGDAGSDVSSDASTCGGPADVTSGLVGWWRFDEMAGPLAGDAIAGHAGSLLGGATWSAGHHGAAIAFDGVDDRVDVGGTVAYATRTKPFTFSAWFELD